MRHLMIGAVLIFAALLATFGIASWLEERAAQTAPSTEAAPPPNASPMPFSKPDPSAQSHSVNMVQHRSGPID